MTASTAAFMASMASSVTRWLAQGGKRLVAVFEMDSMDETPLRMRVPFSKDIQVFPYW